MANGLGNFVSGLLNAVQQSYVSERDKTREQERYNKEEARQNAMLSLQKLQNKQRVDEFNKSFEFQKKQTDIENIRNADKTQFDKLIAYKEYVKQYLPMSSMPKNTDGFTFNQDISGTIDDDFAKATGIDLLKNDEKYYDVNAYKDAYDNWLQKRNSDAYRSSLSMNANKNRIAVVHKPSGTIKYLKEDEYFDKIDEGYYPTDTWVPMTVAQASTLGMSQMGYDKGGKLLNPTSTPGQVADVFQSALENSNAQWFSKIFGIEEGQEPLSASEMLNRLKPSGLKNIEDFNFRGGQFGGSGISVEDVQRLKEFNKNKWNTQKQSNTQNMQGFIENVINPLRESLNSSTNWKDTPSGRQQRQLMEMQVANLVESLKVAYQGIDTGLIDPSVKSDVYNALQLAKMYAKKNAVALELQRRQGVNQGLIKQEIKSLTDK